MMKKEVDDVIASDIPGPQFRNVESRIGCLTTGSRNYSISRPSFQGYPISYQSQPPIAYQSQQSGQRFILNLDRETCDIQLLRSQLAHNFGNTNNVLCIDGGGFSSVQRATPLWAQSSQSTSFQIQPQRFILAECTYEGGRNAVPFIICGQETADHLQSMQAFKNNSRDIDPRILQQGYGNYQSNSTLFLSQENKDICSTSRNSVIPMLRNDDDSFQMLNPEQHQRIQNLSQIGLVPNWSNYSKLEMLNQQHCLQTRFRSMHDAMSMRTFTPVNSVRRANEGPYMNSETNRSFPNGKMVDNSVCKENRLSEKSALDLNKNPCQLSGHSQQGVKVQLRDSATTSGGTDNVQHPSTFPFVSKNELSSETGALNMEIEENHLSGAKYVPVNKDVRMHDKLSSSDVSVFPKEARSKPVIPGIPDLNIALPELPGTDNLMGDLDPSIQRSKISDRGSPHVGEPTVKNRKKRKMSDILNSGDGPQNEIVSKSFKKSGKSARIKKKLKFAGKNIIVIDSDDDDSPALVVGSSSKEMIKVEKQTTSDKNGKTTSAEGVLKTEEISPYRWFGSWPLDSLTKHTVQENPEQTIVYKPQSSNVCSKHIQEQEVPSTATMAAITIDFNKQININDKDNGSHKGPEASSLKPCNK